MHQSRYIKESSRSAVVCVSVGGDDAGQLFCYRKAVCGKELHHVLVINCIPGIQHLESIQCPEEVDISAAGELDCIECHFFGEG